MSATIATVSLRDATADDAPALLALLLDLAIYERAPDAVKMTEADLRHALGNTPPLAHAVIAEGGGKALGCALWFLSFSTWTGRAGISIEDVYVVPEARGQGIGRAIFGELARRAKAINAARIDWRVLDWNTDAIAFYKRLGAEAQTEWTGYRLTGPALAALAQGGEA